MFRKTLSAIARNRLAPLFAVIVLFAAFAETAKAQTCDQPNNKTVSGYVWKAIVSFSPPSISYEPMTGVEVSIFKGESQLDGVATTNSQGFYTFQSTAASCAYVFTSLAVPQNHSVDGGSIRETHIGYSVPPSGESYQEDMSYTLYPVP